MLGASPVLVVTVPSLDQFRTTKEVLTSRSGNDVPSGAQWRRVAHACLWCSTFMCV